MLACFVIGRQEGHTNSSSRHPQDVCFLFLNLGKIQVIHVLYIHDRRVMRLFRELKVAGKWRATTEGSSLLQFRFVTIEEN
jgi:hypothetical protein